MEHHEREYKRMEARERIRQNEELWGTLRIFLGGTFEGKSAIRGTKLASGDQISENLVSAPIIKGVYGG